jgi:tRNA-uridine 2-sulfurtransferase
MAQDRVAIAMSGGVDSSVAAAILKEKGCDLIGFSMQLWDQRRVGSGAGSARPGGCCSLEDFHDARGVAARLGIPYYVVDFEKEFERMVVRDFVESYRKGLTPSPCVLCNSHIKFDQLVRMAEEVEATRVATGHYARVDYDQGSGRYLLRQARDINKDQSYFLFELSQSQLSKAIFPLGDLEKTQVRQLARKYSLPVAEKQDSQEICFIPDGDYAAFVEQYHDEITGCKAKSIFPRGKILDTEGRVLGTHSGIHHYTIGQRRGLGIAHPVPLYVLELRPEENTVVVGERSRLEKHRCRVVRPNWISIDALTEPVHVHAKIRSRHKEAAAIIAPADNGGVEVVFDSPQPAITPGQACVFYQPEKVVGGGWISR